MPVKKKDPTKKHPIIPQVNPADPEGKKARLKAMGQNMSEYQRARSKSEAAQFDAVSKEQAALERKRKNEARKKIK